MGLPGQRHEPQVEGPGAGADRRSRRWATASSRWAKWKAPALEQTEGLPESAWESVGPGGRAILASHRPEGWVEHPHAVVRRVPDAAQGQLFPAHTVILVSRDDLPPAELAPRHRGKQGHENAFKGPGAPSAAADRPKPPRRLKAAPGKRPTARRQRATGTASCPNAAQNKPDSNHPALNRGLGGGARPPLGCQ